MSLPYTRIRGTVLLTSEHAGLVATYDQRGNLMATHHPATRARVTVRWEDDIWDRWSGFNRQGRAADTASMFREFEDRLYTRAADRHDDRVDADAVLRDFLAAWKATKPWSR